MSSILLLLEDGEMHPFVPGSSGSHIILTSDDQGDESGSPGLTYTVEDSENGLSLGNHFLTDDPNGLTKLRDDEGVNGSVVTKLEVDNVPVEVLVEKSKGKKHKKGQKTEFVHDSGEKKVCLWPTGNGTTCSKTFTKFDSLKRHLSEAHKGLRPFACTLCDKTYGRRDYLQRHLKSHNNSYAVSLVGSSTNVASSPSSTSQAIKKTSAVEEQQQNIVLVQQQPNVENSEVQIIHSTANSTITSPSTTTAQSLNPPNPIPFLNLNGQLPTAKPMGSKICRWVQNDGTVCGKAFSKLDSLRRHVNELHKGVRPFACNLCDKSYGRRDYLDRHMKTHEKKANKAAAAAAMPEGSIDWGPHTGVLLSGDEVPPPPKIPKKKRKDIPPEEKKICLWIMEDGTACGKTFTKFDSLKRHVSESHKQIRPYCCSLCGKSYGRRDYLLRHLKSHNDVEVSNITIQKIPNNPSNHPANQMNGLNTSSSSSNGSNEFSPIGFSTVTPTTNHLSRNIISNSNSAKLSTSVASGSSMSSKKKALEDKKTCKWVLDNGTVCGKTFSKFDSLKRHVTELHKNIRPFVCVLCRKSYGRKDYLDRHMKSHMVDASSLKMEEGTFDDPTGLKMESDNISHAIITSDSVTMETDNIETTTTTVVVDTGKAEESEDVGLPNVTVVSNDDV